MVVSLFRAEWIKIVGNRWWSSFLLWIFPVGTLAFVIVIALLIAVAPLFTDADVTGELEVDNLDWTEQAISVWTVPTGLFGRLIVLAFASMLFAGEYQWKTLKTVVPHADRVKLVLVKFFAAAFAIVLTFTLMSFILAAGSFVFAWIGGGHVGPALTGETLADFASDYLQKAWLAFTLTIISANFAALAGMVMRSVLGGLLIGVFFTFVEGLSVLGLALLAHLLDTPKLVYLYRLTPSYNVDNVSSWINNNRPATDDEILQQLSDMFNFADDVMFSIVILTLWVVGLIALTAYLFHRQDIT